MPYLTNVEQEQIERGASSGTLRISWVFGDLMPDVIEVRRPGDAATPATLLAEVPVEAGTPLYCDRAFSDGGRRDVVPLGRLDSLLTQYLLDESLGRFRSPCDR